MDSNDVLEKAKDELYNINKIQEYKDKPGWQATVFSIIKTFPVLGEWAYKSFENSILDLQKSKREILLNVIFSDSAQVTSDMVKDVEFLMNFMKTLEAVNRLSNNDKVVYFGSLLKNGYLSGNKIDDSFFEECLYALNTLSYRQINILIELYLFEKTYIDGNEFDSHGKKQELLPRSKNWNVFIESACNKCNIDTEILIGLLYSISKTGFCKEITGSYLGYNGGVFAITEYCRKFIEMILIKQ